MSKKFTFGWPLMPVLGVILVFFLGASVSLAAHHEEPQTTASDVKKEALETYDAFKRYTLEQRDKAIEAADKKLAVIDENLDAIQKDIDKRWQAMGDAARTKNRDMIRKLNKERENVAEWYGGMRHSSAEAWEDVKKGFAESYDRLERAFAEARQDFEKDKEE